MRQNEINHRAVGFFGPFYYNEVKNGKIRTFTVQFFKLFKLREENLSNLTHGQFRGRLLMFFARSFKVLGIRFWQTFNSQSTLMVVLYPKIFFSTLEYAENGVISNPLVLRPDSCQVYEEDGVKIRNT